MGHDIFWQEALAWSFFPLHHGLNLDPGYPVRIFVTMVSCLFLVCKQLNLFNSDFLPRLLFSFQLHLELLQLILAICWPLTALSSS